MEKKKARINSLKTMHENATYYCQVLPNLQKQIYPILYKLYQAREVHMPYTEFQKCC